MPTRLEVEIWSDVVCPWCYVGKRRFEAALARFDHRDAVAVRWRSFELDPRAPRAHDGEGDYASRLARKYGTDVRRAREMIDRMVGVAKEEGLAFDFERARPGNTFDAHRLLHFALDRGRQGELKERLLRATFTEGEPIGDRETLVRLAGEVGLDEDAARAVVLGDAYAKEVREDEAEAKAIGISGVPFFAIGGRYGVSGAQSPEVILSVLDRAWREGRVVTVAEGPSCGDDGDRCAAPGDDVCA